MSDDLAKIRARHTHIPQDALPIDVPTTGMGGVAP